MHCFDIFDFSIVFLKILLFLLSNIVTMYILHRQEISIICIFITKNLEFSINLFHHSYHTFLAAKCSTINIFFALIKKIFLQTLVEKGNFYIPKSCNLQLVDSCPCYCLNLCCEKSNLLYMQPFSSLVNTITIFIS